MLNIIYCILALVILPCIIMLQIFLSKRDSLWPGLILPSISFLFSIAFSLLSFAPSEGISFGYIMGEIIMWLLLNIPTYIFLTIYFICQKKRRCNKQLNKMNIQDLD